MKKLIRGHRIANLDHEHKLCIIQIPIDIQVEITQSHSDRIPHSGLYIVGERPSPALLHVLVNAAE